MTREVEIPTCPQIPAPAPALEVVMPGGLKIVSVPSLAGGIVDELAQAQSMVLQLGPALAGLQPVFTIINAVIAIFDVVKSIPQSIATLDIVGLIDSISEAGEAIYKVAQLHPAISLPATIQGIVGVVVAFLRGMRTQVEAVGEEMEAAQALLDKATEIGDVNLEQVAQCQMDNAAQTLQHLAAGLGPVGDILEILTSLSELFGGGAMPGFDNPAGKGVEELLALLDGLIAALEPIAG